MAALFKHVGQSLPVIEILFIRQLSVLAIMSPVILREFPGIFKTDHFRLHLLRILIALVSMTAGFTAIVNMPLAEVTAINFVRTLFVTLLAIVILREIVGIRRWASMIVGFIGVLIVIRPDADGINAYALLALLSAMLLAGIMIILRKISQVDRPATIMANFSVFIIVIMAGPAWYVWKMPTLLEVGTILVIGALMSAMQWCYIKGLKVGEASAVAPMEYVRLLFAAVLGMIFFNEFPTLWTITGAAIIIGSTLYTVRRSAAKKQTIETVSAEG